MTFLLTDEAVRASHAELLARVVQLLEESPPGDYERPCPTCPGWRALDVASHIAGVVDDLLAQRFDGAGTDPWTATQVEARKERSFLEVASEISALMQAFDTLMGMLPAPINSQVVMDQVTHEHDLRTALGRPGAKDSAAVTAGLGFMLHGAAASDENLVASVQSSAASEFEKLRSLTGRHTLDQMNSLGIDGDAVARFLAGGPMSVPPSVVEDIQ